VATSTDDRAFQDFRQLVSFKRAAECGSRSFDLPAQVFSKLFRMSSAATSAGRSEPLASNAEKFHTMLLNNKLHGDPGEEGEHVAANRRAAQREGRDCFIASMVSAATVEPKPNGQEVFHIRTTH